MSRRKVINTLVLYMPFIGLLFINFMSLVRAVTMVAGEMERNIRILTAALMINAIIGEMGSLLVIERFGILLTGKKSSIVDDIREESSEDVAVRYNGVVVSSFICVVLFILYGLYIITEKRLFFYMITTIITVFFIGLISEVLVLYLKIRDNYPESIFSKWSNPAFLPMIICLIQFLVVREKLVGFVYRNICVPKNDISLILILIFVLCYFLVIAFCHFSNAYCLIGFWFAEKNVRKMRRKKVFIQGKEEVREKSLRQTTKYVDEKAEQVGLVGRCGIAVYYYFVHVKNYIQERFYVTLYLLSYIKLEIIKRLSGLLEPERIKLNAIRFCGIMAVLELLALDMLLFIYLESSDPCLKFFELLSTVVIIPVLLSWLSELKSKKSE